jgi:hypothetical protein
MVRVDNLRTAGFWLQPMSRFCRSCPRCHAYDNSVLQGCSLIGAQRGWRYYTLEIVACSTELGSQDELPHLMRYTCPETSLFK